MKAKRYNDEPEFSNFNELEMIRLAYYVEDKESCRCSKILSILMPIKTLYGSLHHVNELFLTMLGNLKLLDQICFRSTSHDTVKR